MPNLWLAIHEEQPVRIARTSKPNLITVLKGEETLPKGEDPPVVPDGVWTLMRITINKADVQTICKIIDGRNFVDEFDDDAECQYEKEGGEVKAIRKRK